LVPGGVAALFSCKPGQFARETDTLKHGVFFHFVLQGLRGEAKNGDGGVSSLASLTPAPPSAVHVPARSPPAASSAAAPWAAPPSGTSPRGCRSRRVATARPVLPRPTRTGLAPAAIPHPALFRACPASEGTAPSAPCRLP